MVEHHQPKVELAVKLAIAACRNCGCEKNSREAGGNVHCFHCGKCGYMECADTDLYPEGEVE